MLLELKVLLSLKELVAKVTTPIFSKKGMYYSQLITKWPQIVGDAVARQSMPLKLVRQTKGGKEYGILTILAHNSAASTIIGYQLPLMQEKISQFFGFPLVDSIRIVHQPMQTEARENVASTLTNLDPAAQQSIINMLEDLDANLASPLQNLGNAVAAKQKL